VTTTDVDTSTGPRGALVNKANVRVITPPGPGRSEAEVAALFASNVTVGINGSGTEKGLEAAYLALSEPNVNGVNSGFLRPDAYLSIIIVSDESDQSDRDLDFYTNFFQSLKGARGQNLVSISGIINTADQRCGAGDLGTRYEEMAKRTGGISEAICTENWSASLQKLGLQAFGFKSRFILGTEPIPDTIRVYIDGQEIEKGPLWIYTPEANSIDFHPLAVPPAGKTVRVTYSINCLTE